MHGEAFASQLSVAYMYVIGKWLIPVKVYRQYSAVHSSPRLCDR
jgi:hypothetical protein